MLRVDAGPCPSQSTAIDPGEAIKELFLILFGG